MAKVLSRQIGCMTLKRQCPCGDEQCIIRVDADEEVLVGDVPVLDVPLSTAPGSFPAAEVPFVGQIFHTDEEAQEYYKNFARKNGFSIRTERSKGNSSHPMGVYKRELVCHRAGVYRPRKTDDLKRQRNKKSSRCKCEAQMIIRKNVCKGKDNWVVVQFSNVHNHDLLDSEGVRHLPAYRNIPTLDRERILTLSKAGCSVNHIMRTIEMEKGVKADKLTFTERDLRNFLQIMKNCNRENEGEELLKACKALKDSNPGFQYEYTVDANDKLENLCWAHSDSVLAYKVFGDAVVLDTRYRLYAYDRPIAIWFGIDNHGNMIIFGWTLLQYDSPFSLRWSLQSFVQLMDGKFPHALLTDFDLGLKEAVLVELPNTKHAFSSMFILSKLPIWFSSILGPQFERFSLEFRRISNLDNTDDFTHQWDQMINEFGLSTDRHIAMLAYNLDYWSAAILRGSFFAGLLMNDVSTFVKSILNGPLNSLTRLRDFVEQAGVAVELQNQAAEEITLKQNYLHIKMKTCMPIEEHAASVLTPYAFELFQKELVLSMQFAVYETQEQAYLVQHHLQSSAGHLVQYLPSDDLLQCSCKEFESSGILCSHILRVLSLKNCFTLPDKYILFRWRRESSLFPRSSGYKYRSGILRSLASFIIQEASLSNERFSYVQWHMNKLLADVREMPKSEQEAGTDGEAASSLDVSVDVTPTQRGQRAPKGRSKKAKPITRSTDEITEAAMGATEEPKVLPEPHELWESNDFFGTQELFDPEHPAACKP